MIRGELTSDFDEMIKMVKKSPGSDTGKGLFSQSGCQRGSQGAIHKTNEIATIAETERENENRNLGREIDVPATEARECYPGDEQAQY